MTRIYHGGGVGLTHARGDGLSEVPVGLADAWNKKLGIGCPSPGFRRFGFEQTGFFLSRGLGCLGLCACEFWWRSKGRSDTESTNLIDGQLPIVGCSPILGAHRFPAGFVHSEAFESRPPHSGTARLTLSPASETFPTTSLCQKERSTRIALGPLSSQYRVAVALTGWQVAHILMTSA